MIKCSRPNRFGDFSKCSNEKPSNTAAAKEMETKLSNTLAERERQDAELWGKPKEKEPEALSVKKMQYFANAGN